MFQQMARFHRFDRTVEASIFILVARSDPGDPPHGVGQRYRVTVRATRCENKLQGVLGKRSTVGKLPTTEYFL
jgi:hypothetical protein